MRPAAAHQPVAAAPAGGRDDHPDHDRDEQPERAEQRDQSLVVLGVGVPLRRRAASADRGAAPGGGGTSPGSTAVSAACGSIMP